MSDTATTATSGRIRGESRAPLFVITIDRPAKRNAFTPAMLTQLAEAYTAYEADAACRCAVVCAAGDHFTGGLDLTHVAPHIATGNTLFPPGSIDPFDMRSPRRTGARTSGPTGAHSIPAPSDSWTLALIAAQS